MPASRATFVIWRAWATFPRAFKKLSVESSIAAFRYSAGLGWICQRLEEGFAIGTGFLSHAYSRLLSEPGVIRLSSFEPPQMR